MEDNIKIVELKNKKQIKRVLNILEKNETKNIYLLEGIESENPNNKNLVVYQENRLISVVHIKLHRYVHIHCFTNNQTLNLKLGDKLKSGFPDIRSIFGERESVYFFKKIYTNCIDKTLVYTFMELLKENFKPDHNNNYPGISQENFKITESDYHGIISLQISYEIEELEIDPSKIKKEILAKVIDVRIKRGEMTVLKIGNKPIGIAGVNARYKNICQVGSVYINKAYRGRGYGTLLLSEHLKKLFKIYDKIVLFVRNDNQTAYNLYKKLGFIVKGKLGQIILKENQTNAN